MIHLYSKNAIASNISLCGEVQGPANMLKSANLFLISPNRCPECYAMLKENETPSDIEARAENENILSKAKDIVYSGLENQERRYGSPKESFYRASTIASILCNKEITPEDVVKIQMALKLSRESVHHKEDNLVDLCGYASILNDLENEKANN